VAVVLAVFYVEPQKVLWLQVLLQVLVLWPWPLRKSLRKKKHLQKKSLLLMLI